MFAFDNFEIGALYLIQDFMRTPKLTDFLESMTDLGNAGFNIGRFAGTFHDNGFILGNRQLLA